MMPREFVFESCLTPYLQGLIEEKHACGKLYDTEGLILKRFDKYCIEHELSGTTVTREFLRTCRLRTAARSLPRLMAVRT